MMLKESDLCRNQFERTEAGFDRKNETLRGLKESILDLSRSAEKLAKSAFVIGFVAAMGAGCSSIEEDSFKVGVDCPEDSSLDVRDTEVQGIVTLVCFSDTLNADGELEKYSPISVVNVEGLSNDEIPDEYDYRIDFGVSYAHHPGREFSNNFTVTYGLQADPVFENIEFHENTNEGSTHMDVGRRSIKAMKITKIGEQ
jgi:hypothetical protein